MKHNISALLAIFVLFIFSSCRIDEGDTSHAYYQNINTACDVMVKVCHGEPVSLFRNVYRLNRYMQMDEEQKKDIAYSDIMYCPSTSTYTIDKVGDFFTDDKLISEVGTSWSVCGDHHYIFTSTGANKWEASIIIDENFNNFYPLYGMITCNIEILVTGVDANGNPEVRIGTTGVYKENSDYEMTLEGSYVNNRWVKTSPESYALYTDGEINIKIRRSGRVLNICTYSYTNSANPIITTN